MLQKTLLSIGTPVLIALVIFVIQSIWTISSRYEHISGQVADLRANMELVKRDLEDDIDTVRKIAIERYAVANKRIDAVAAAFTGELSNQQDGIYFILDLMDLRPSIKLPNACP